MFLLQLATGYTLNLKVHVFPNCDYNCEYQVPPSKCLYQVFVVPSQLPCCRLGLLCGTYGILIKIYHVVINASKAYFVIATIIYHVGHI